MSTNRATKPGQRQADYSNIGYAGRKTGVVLKQTGTRDEYGMPAIDDLFSSPQRIASPVKTNSQPNGVPRSSIVAQENFQTNTQPEPTQYSSPRKSIPPRARSPIKTSIGSPRKSLNGSPTKTMGLLASPVRIGSRIQNRVGGQEGIDNSFADSRHKRRSLEQAPKRPPVSNSSATKPNPHLQPPRRSVFEVPSSPAVKQATTSRATSNRTSNVRTAASQSISPIEAYNSSKQRGSTKNQKLSPRPNGKRVDDADEPSLFVSQEYTSPVLPSPAAAIPVDISEQPIRQQPSKKAKGKRRLDDIEAEEKSRATRKPVSPAMKIQEPQSDSEPEAEFEPFAGVIDDYEPDLDIEEEIAGELDIEAQPDLDEEIQPPVVPSPKRPPSVSKPVSSSPRVRFAEQSHKRQSPFEEELEDTSPQPSKKARLSPKQAMPPPAKATAKLAASKQAKGRNGNIATMLGGAKQKRTAEADQSIAPPPPPLGKARPKSRGLQIMKGDTEAEVDGARYTRSGRTSVKPVEYWRGERIIYTEPRREGGRVSLPGIKEVIRVEDEPQALKSKSKRKAGRSQKRQPSPESEEDDIEQEWELEPGVFAGEVPSWDSLEQRGDPEYPEQVDLAIAPRGLESLTREVKGASFHYAKTITLPFFHSGMVDLPPGGEKKTKNSRRNHMVFWVFSGRVVVDVSGNEFSLGKGGMWQVPRGNTYSVNNPYEQPARIFFAQGCYMTEEEGNAYEEEAEAAEAAQE